MFAIDTNPGEDIYELERISHRIALSNSSNY